MSHFVERNRYLEDICDFCSYIRDEGYENENIRAIHEEAARNTPDLDVIRKQYHACYQKRKLKKELKPVAGHMRRIGIRIRKLYE